MPCTVVQKVVLDVIDYASAQRRAYCPLKPAKQLPRKFRQSWNARRRSGRPRAARTYLVTMPFYRKVRVGVFDVPLQRWCSPMLLAELGQRRHSCQHAHPLEGCEQPHRPAQRDYAICKMRWQQAGQWSVLVGRVECDGTTTLKQHCWWQQAGQWLNRSERIRCKRVPPSGCVAQRRSGHGAIGMSHKARSSLWCADAL